MQIYIYFHMLLAAAGVSMSQIVVFIVSFIHYERCNPIHTWWRTSRPSGTAEDLNSKGQTLQCKPNQFRTKLLNSVNKAHSTGKEYFHFWPILNFDQFTCVTPVGYSCLGISLSKSNYTIVGASLQMYHLKRLPRYLSKQPELHQMMET